MMSNPKFLTSCLLVTIAIFLNIHTSEQAAKSKLIEVNEDNWVDLLKDEWFVDFYAPWCPACKQLQPEWDKLVDWSKDLNLKVASADVTKYPGLSGRFMVSGLPTIYHVKDGVFRIYNGPRNHKDLINFVEEHKWRDIEPVSRVWRPDSLQMSAISCLFRASMALRDIHNYLTEEVGLPYYLSYFVFALCTVIVGTVLGVLIVFVVDLIFPTRYSSDGAEQAKAASKRKKDKKEDDSDLEDTHADDRVEETASKSESPSVRRRAN